MSGVESGDGIAIEVHGAASAAVLLDVVNELYREVFSLPPFDATEAVVRDQRGYFPKVAARPGFRLVLARSSGRYVGFGYGYMLPSDSTWWAGLQEPLDETFTRETGRRTFAVIDYGVLQAWRGLGIGRSVHDGLLDGSGAERATLAVRPGAVETQAIYGHWGWRSVGREVMDPPAPSPVFDILVLEEMPEPTATS